MIDLDVLQGYIWDANPIPHVGDLDPVELAAFVAAANTRRAANMQPPTQHSTPTIRPPLRRHRKAWAFAFLLVLVSIGIAALALRRDNTSVADEPAPSTTAPEPPTTMSQTPQTTLAETPLPIPAVGLVRAAWDRVNEPWAGSIIDVASLPTGGFVVGVSDGGSVFWSTDGVEWNDADPQRQVTPHRAVDPYGFLTSQPQVITVTADRVFILNGSEPGVWIGDLKASVWESIQFDIADLAGEVNLLAIASHETGVLVIAEQRTSEPDEPHGGWSARDYLVWLIDPNTGEVERHPLPVVEDEFDDWEEGTWHGAVQWFDGRWVIMLEASLLVSSDGAAWTQVPVNEYSVPLPVAVRSLTVGPDGIIATQCSMDDPLWYSENGLEWAQVRNRGGHRSTYSETLGFIVGGEPLEMSSDGRTWYNLNGGPPNVDSPNLAASQNRVFVVVSRGAWLLTAGD